MGVPGLAVVRIGVPGLCTWPGMDEDMTTACSPRDANKVVGPWLHPSGLRGCKTHTRAILPCSWCYFQPAPLCCGEGLTLGVSACQTWPPELQADRQPAGAGWGLWAGTRGLREQGSEEGTVSCSVDGPVDPRPVLLAGSGQPQGLPKPAPGLEGRHGGTLQGSSRKGSSWL